MDVTERDAPLPLRVRPHDDESLAGLVIRLAERNNISTPLALLRGAGVLVATVDAVATLSLDLSGLAALSGIEERRLAAMRYPPAQRPGSKRACIFRGHVLSTSPEIMWRVLR